MVLETNNFPSNSARAKEEVKRDDAVTKTWNEGTGHNNSYLSSSHRKVEFYHIQKERVTAFRCNGDQPSIENEFCIPLV